MENIFDELEASYEGALVRDPGAILPLIGLIRSESAYVLLCNLAGDGKHTVAVSLSAEGADIDEPGVSLSSLSGDISSYVTDTGGLVAAVIDDPTGAPVSAVVAQDFVSLELVKHAPTFAAVENTATSRNLSAGGIRLLPDRSRITSQSYSIARGDSVFVQPIHVGVSRLNVSLNDSRGFFAAVGCQFIVA